MKKMFVLAIACLMALPSFADEGMWLPMFLNRLKYSDLQKDGLHLTPEEIYSINNSSLKDAIPIFGRGCTSEVVSESGLLFTNHHCGYDAIASLSTVEHDYLHDGFWAKNYGEELPAEGLAVSFFVRMEDVTNQVQSQLKPGMTEEERAKKIAEISKEIVQKAEEDGKYRAQVKSFYAGNEFYLIVYQDFTDVRLVATPPSSIGKFGGETDNWMWPRHTGDFSIFRIYADKDNNPAPYSRDNVPYKPKKHLSINIADKNPGDFQFIMGYPGSTERYLPSWGIDYLVNDEYPAFVKGRDVILNVLRDEMAQDQAINLMYASKFAMISNYWKNRMGMIKALTKLKTADKKREQEADLKKWISQSKDRQAKYGNIFTDFENYYSAAAQNAQAVQYLSEAGLRGSSLAALGMWLPGSFIKEDADSAKMERSIKTVERYFAGADVAVEKKLMKAGLELIATLPEAQQPDQLKVLVKKYGSVAAVSDAVAANSMLFNKAKFENAIRTSDVKGTENDEGVKLFNSVAEKYYELRDANQALEEAAMKADRLFISALRESRPDKAFYPDANFTMRATFGKVLPYDPADAVTYHHISYLDGVIEKYVPGDIEFDVPARLIELYNSKDFGRYAAPNGKMPVNYLTNHDITGGNSGSPVLDGKGNLVGLAFDGNWEAMSGDVEFEPNLQRTINLDIRYVLFIIDKFAGAQNIIDELDIVNDTPKKKK